MTFTQNAMVFDIETVPVSPEACADLIPPFDPASVKLGQRKDPDKIKEYLAEAEAKHRQNFLNRAALNPLTARIAAIGISTVQSDTVYIDNEPTLIRLFFEAFTNEGDIWVGFNISNFDVPMLVKRAWALGIPLPTKRHLLNQRNRLSDWFIDLAEVWRCGVYSAEPISLDRLGRFLGVGKKEVNGSAFAALMYQPEQARAYLLNDLQLTWAIGERLGVLTKGPMQADEPGQPADDLTFY